MKETLEVTQQWHRSLLELPEDGREVLGLCFIDRDNDEGDRFGLMSDMFYFKKGTVLSVEADRKVKIEWKEMPKKSPEERLLNAIFGNQWLQEIEHDGWYTFDSLNDEGLMRYRFISEEPVYWCYPMMPDGIEMNRMAEIVERGE